MPKRQKIFESYFSPAERAYTDYLHANIGSVLGASRSQQATAATQSKGTMSAGRVTRNEIGDEEPVSRSASSPFAKALWRQSSSSTVRGLLRGSEAAASHSDPQLLKSSDSAFESPDVGSQPKNEPNERARQRAAENSGRFGDYNDGDVAKTVDAVIDSSSWSDRRLGVAGRGVNGKGRYIWTKYGWVDLQHVIGAATTTDDPILNELLGVAKEVEQFSGGMKSGFKREDLLSNAIGASALAYQRVFGGTIGQAVAHVLGRLRPVTRQQADKFLRNGGQAEPWP